MIITKSLNYIKLYNSNYTETDLLEIKYGLASIYSLITKTIIIFSVSIILNLFKELITFCFFYNFIRMTSFGLHASTSRLCTISSLIIFLLIPYLSINIYIDYSVQMLAIILSTILLTINSPADTIKRPIIDKTRRNIYKLITLLVCIFYILLFIFINNMFIKNIIMYSILFQSIITSPITYKLFKLQYNNYLNYV